MVITVDEEIRGRRIDVLIGERLTRLSRAYIQKLCEQGKVCINGEPAKAGHRAKMGEEITVDYDESYANVVPDIELPVLYEDDDCIVINKPAGVLSHAQGSLALEPTVATFLRQHSAGGESLSGDDSAAAQRSGIVHRLDRATSGVMIGAKNPAALSFLQKQFARRSVIKTYLAIVDGHPKEKEAIIDMPIERNPKSPATFRVGANGKASKTHYSVLKVMDQSSLLGLKPETGRTHQLRVHLAHIGHPIIGDPLYGSGKYGDRLYLHAYSLEITLPNNEHKLFVAEPPEEFAQYLNLDI